METTAEVQTPELAAAYAKAERGEIAIPGQEEAEDKIYGSLDDFVKAGGQDIEYATIKGFRDGEVFRIGSVTSGDIIEWSEAKTDDAKKTAGLRLICKSLVGPPPANVRYADSTSEVQMQKNVNLLRKVRHKEIERVVELILKHNGMKVRGRTDEATENAKNA